MPKTKDKLNSSNTLLNYFAKSPASNKIARKETPENSLTPKSITKAPVEVTKQEVVSPAEDEIVSRKRRRRIVLSDGSDNSDAETATSNGVKLGVKGLSSFERKEDVCKLEDENANVEANLVHMSKKIKTDVIASDSIKEDRKDISNLKDDLDEPTVWLHQKLDFLKPKKIKDIQGNGYTSDKYDHRTLYVPESFLNTLTPAMRQWWELKSRHYDCVLFFKVGKFYELYHMDAEIGVQELGFSYMKGDFAHSGFPETAYDRMSTTLIEKGYKVARVEQTETPEMMQERCKQQKVVTKYDKVVKREICQITLNGTEVFGQQVRLTANHQPKYMLSIVEKMKNRSESRFGVCFVDTSIGKFHFGEFDDDSQLSRMLTLLSHYPPSLVLHERTVQSENMHKIYKTVLAGIKKEALTNDSQLWSVEKTMKYLADNVYGSPKETATKWPKALLNVMDENDTLGLKVDEHYQLAMKAFGGCIWYLKRCLLDHQVLTLANFELYFPLDFKIGKQIKSETARASTCMVLDSITLNNLKVIGNEQSLIDRMDHCCTKFGKRLLHQWICSPSGNRETIMQRQCAVTELMENVNLLQDVRQLLAELPDMERQLAQIHSFGSIERSRNHPDGRAILYEEHTYGKKKINDFISTLRGFRSLASIPDLFRDVESELLVHLTQHSTRQGVFPMMTEKILFFEQSFDHDQALKSGVIKPGKGLDVEFDEVEKEIAALERTLEQYRKEQEKFFGCKIVYFGNDKKRFQLEVFESHAKKANNDYTLEGQKKGKNGVKRYHTEETKKFLKRMIQLEDKKKKVLKDLARRVFEKFSSDYELWKGCVDLVATLDVLTSLAEYARSEGNMCVPEILTNDHAPTLQLKAGIHPCVSDSENYIPNGVNLEDGESKLILLTGPNMGGKSTLMRQVGLLVVMAQIGSRVPAEMLRMTIIDRIFTRLGANDDIMAGNSTFLVELNETSAILRHATERSLVLLDELGRGTATYDGTAVAGAVVNFLATLNCRTMFSTHYHNLVDYFHDDPRITLGHMACMVENEVNDDPTEATVTFLYKYSEGACPKSYGFNAAKLAGMPKTIIKRAYELSKTVETETLKRKLLMKILKKAELSEAKDLIVKLKACQL